MTETTLFENNTNVELNLGLYYERKRKVQFDIITLIPGEKIRIAMGYGLTKITVCNSPQTKEKEKIEKK